MTVSIQTPVEMVQDSGSFNEDIVRAAKALYQLGLNVFPVVRPDMVCGVGEFGSENEEAISKRAYLLKPLFHSRLHYCTDECERLELETGRICLGRNQRYQFDTLFDYSNLGLILGRTSRNMACLDCDTQSSYETVKRQFNDRGLEFWAYKSGRGGGILFRCVEGEIGNKRSCRIPSVEVLGHSHYCTLPPSRHHSGCFYLWDHSDSPSWEFHEDSLPAAIPLNELQWLGIRLKKAQPSTHTIVDLPEWTKLLSGNVQKILVSNILDGYRNTQLTHSVYSIAVLIDRDLVDFHEALEVLGNAADHCKPPYDRSQVKNMLECALNKRNLTTPEEYYHSPRRPAFDVAPYLAWAHQYDWRKHGRYALSLRSVFAACCYRAFIESSKEFRASSREIAEIANIQDHRTTSRALSRMVESGILVRCEPDSSGASRFSFADNSESLQCTTNIICNDSGALKRTLFEADLPMTNIERNVFRGLGINAYLVWKHLQKTIGSPNNESIEGCHLAKSTVYRSLEKLEKYGLITYSGAEGVYIANQPTYEEMEQISVQLGTHLNAEKRKHKFRIEREINLNRQMAAAIKRHIYILIRYKKGQS